MVITTLDRCMDDVEQYQTERELVRRETERMARERRILMATDMALALLRHDLEAVKRAATAGTATARI